MMESIKKIALVLLCGIILGVAGTGLLSGQTRPVRTSLPNRVRPGQNIQIDIDNQAGSFWIQVIPARSNRIAIEPGDWFKDGVAVPAGIEPGETIQIRTETGKSVIYLAPKQDFTLDIPSNYASPRVGFTLNQ